MNQDQNKKTNIIHRYKQTFKLVKDLWRLIIKNKKWWLVPIFAVFAIFSLFITLVGGSSILPAIYAIF